MFIVSIYIRMTWETHANAAKPFISMSSLHHRQIASEQITVLSPPLYLPETDLCQGSGPGRHRSGPGVAPSSRFEGHAPSSCLRGRPRTAQRRPRGRYRGRPRDDPEAERRVPGGGPVSFRSFQMLIVFVQHDRSSMESVKASVVSQPSVESTGFIPKSCSTPPSTVLTVGLKNASQ